MEYFEVYIYPILCKQFWKCFQKIEHFLKKYWQWVNAHFKFLKSLKNTFDYYNFTILLVI